MKYFEPHNRHLWIEIEEEKKKPQSAVLLPEDYKPTQNPHRTVEVVEDPQGEYTAGTLIVVPTHVVHEIKIKNDLKRIIKKNGA